MKQSAIEHGRQGSDVKIFPGIGPIVGRTAAEAEDKYQAIRNLLTIDEALAYLGRYFDHHDFTQYALDAPFPELGGSAATASARPPTGSRPTRNKGLSLRETALAVATPRPNFIGTAEHVADELIRWHDAGAGDGFILGFAVQAQGVEDFIELVIPVLEARGRYSRDLPGATLRDHLGPAQGQPPRGARRARNGGRSARLTPAGAPSAARPPDRFEDFHDMSDTTHLGGALPPLFPGARDAGTRFRIVPARHRSRTAGTVLAVALIAIVLHSILGNPQWAGRCSPNGSCRRPCCQPRARWC